MENTRVGPFLIINRLGTNRRQRVFHARQEKQGRDVALKFITVPPKFDWDKALEKIKLEVDVLKQLKHPNLVQALGAGVADEKVFFASELVKGESLAAILSRRGRLAPDLVVEIGRQIADLMVYLHQRDVIHAKLSPDKIIVDSKHFVKVSDLRLNRSKLRRWDSVRKRELDIAAYMAPEQFTEGASEKSDIYALGVILFEMLTGKLPYEPDTMARMARKKMNEAPPSVAAHVMNSPIWLDKIVTQMLSPDARKRPHSARAVVFAFDEIKKIDKTKKTAAAQISGNFNPLTAGTDKTEADRLLGKKKRKKSSEQPFYESVWFLTLCLVLIAATIGYALIPTSSKVLFDRASKLMASDVPSDWRDARDPLDKIRKRGETGEFYQQADAMYFESRKRALLIQAEHGNVLRGQSYNTKDFCHAFDLQRKKEIDKAIEIFKQLIENTSSDGKERHIHFAAQEMLERLEGYEPPIPMPSDIESLNPYIEKLATAESKSELENAATKLAEVILEFSGKDEYNATVKYANQARARVLEKLEALKNVPPNGDGTSDPTQTDSENTAPGQTDSTTGNSAETTS